MDVKPVNRSWFYCKRCIRCAHTNDNGSGLIYSEPIYVQKQKWLLNACPVIGPSIEFDSSGRMHVFYFTGNGTEGTGYYYVTSDDLEKTFSSPQSILTSDFIPASAIQTDLSIDGKGNVWLTFGTVPDVIEPEENPVKTINVVVMDKQGKIIGKTSFDSRQSISSTPSLASHGSNTFLSYSDGETTRILSLSLYFQLGTSYHIS